MTARPSSTTAPPSPVHNVGSWVSHWARRRGGHLAVADDERRLSWAAFEERVARLAGWLREAGVARGDRVAIVLANRTAYLEAVFAAARIGAVGLPVNTRLSPRELGFILGDAEPAALLHERDLADLVARALERAGHAPLLRVAVGEDGAAGAVDDYEAGLAAATPEPRMEAVSPEDPMMLMYTSGTTGQPKGALLPHRKTLYNSLNAQLFFGIRPDDRVLVVAPLFHSLGLLILSVPILYAGGGLVLQRGFDAAAVWQAIERERISYMGGVPTMYQRLHEWWSENAATAPDAGSLRFLFTAGAAIAVELIHAFEERGLVLKQGYGQTETSILCCLDAADAVRKAGSVGLPVCHVELRVVRREDLDGPVARWRDAAPGETGEIVVRGPITMLGYWRQPEATAETLREQGWLRTGDLASTDEEGFVTLSGRARDMYISGGENVYPAEVEAVYTEHPGVREIAVVGVPHPKWGEVGRAFVVTADGSPVDGDALVAWGKERLATFKLPVEWLDASELPRTASGKVQKHRLGED
ncbi:MAG: AMP-binding protein [Myxococcota bacterium]